MASKKEDIHWGRQKLDKIEKAMTKDKLIELKRVMDRLTQEASRRDHARSASGATYGGGGGSGSKTHVYRGLDPVIHQAEMPKSDFGDLEEPYRKWGHLYGQSEIEDYASPRPAPSSPNLNDLTDRFSSYTTDFTMGPPIQHRRLIDDFQAPKSTEERYSVSLTGDVIHDAGFMVRVFERVLPQLERQNVDLRVEIPGRTVAGTYYPELIRRIAGLFSIPKYPYDGHEVEVRLKIVSDNQPMIEGDLVDLRMYTLGRMYSFREMVTFRYYSPDLMGNEFRDVCTQLVRSLFESDPDVVLDYEDILNIALPPVKSLDISEAIKRLVKSKYIEHVPNRNAYRRYADFSLE